MYIYCSSHNKKIINKLLSYFIFSIVLSNYKIWVKICKMTAKTNAVDITA